MNELIRSARSRRPRRASPRFVVTLCLGVALTATAQQSGPRANGPYSGVVWVSNPLRGEVARLEVHGRDRHVASVDGFSLTTLLAADASADWAWATQHGVFGGLVRLVPSERAITPVEGVPAPEALAVSPVDGTLWAVDTDTDTVFAVSRDGRLIRELHSLRRPLTVGVRPEGGVWVGCADTLVKLDDDGDVMAGIELGRAFTHLDVDLRDDSVWALLDGPRELVRVTTDMEVAHRVGAPGARFVVAAPATGGCWVAMDDRVVHVNDEAHGPWATSISCGCRATRPTILRG